MELISTTLEYLQNSRIGLALLPTGVFLFMLGGTHIAFRFVWRRLALLASRSLTRWDDAILHTLETPSRIYLVLFSLAFSLQFAPEFLHTNSAVRYLLRIGVILNSAWSSYRLLDLVFREEALHSKLSGTTRALLTNVSRVTVGLVTLLVILDNLHISITPLLASLGLGSVAAGLALQNTLANFFGGFFILLEGPIRIGDFIQTESGLEGYVTRIGWRSTQIRLATNNMAIIPNVQISSQRLVNYDLVDASSLFTVSITLPFQSDLEALEDTLLEIAARTQNEHPAGVPGFVPVVRFAGFEPLGIETNVLLKARKFVDQNYLKHGFVKALQARLKHLGVAPVMPHFLTPPAFVDRDLR